MIIKSRKKPILIQKLEVLVRRLRPDHPKYALIKERLSRELAGYKGECSIDYPLSLISNDKFSILHNLRIQVNGLFFQMDTLLLHPNYIVHLEVKNLAGTLFFDNEFHQLKQTIDGVEKVLSDPLTQIERQKLLLGRWLTQNHFPETPIVSMVVVSNSSANIQCNPNDKTTSKKVIRSDYLPFKINQFEERYKKECLSEKEVRKLARILIKQDTPLDEDILQKFQIHSHEIIQGIHCEKCEAYSMTRGYGTWYCPKCKAIDKSAHISALKDYQLLFGPIITSCLALKFLQITSPHLATRILKSLSLSSVGATKGTKYTLGLFD